MKEKEGGKGQIKLSADTQSFISQAEALVKGGHVRNYKEIYTSIGIGPTLLSNIRNGRKNIPAIHYKKFTEVYLPANNAQENNKDANSFPDCEDVASESYTGKYTDEIIRDLARGTVVVGESNKILSSNNQRLINIIESRYAIYPTSSGDVKESQQEFVSDDSTVLIRLADGGVGKFWRTRGEGLAELGSMLTVDQLAKK